MSKRLILFIFVLLLNLSSCGIIIEKRTEYKGYLEIVEKDLSLKIDEVYSLNIKTNLTGEVSFISSDSDVIQCSQDGKLVAMKPGTTIITASVSRFTSRVEVSVVDEKVDYALTDYRYWIGMVPDNISVFNPIMNKNEISDFNTFLYPNFEINEVCIYLKS